MLCSLLRNLLRDVRYASLVTSGVVLGIAVLTTPGSAAKPVASKGDVCEVLASALKEDREYQVLTAMSAERQLGVYQGGGGCEGRQCVAPGELAELHGAHERGLVDLVALVEQQDIQVSKVDVDNDGFEEFRFHTRIGSAEWERTKP